MKNLAENIWVLPFELKALGANIGRNVTVIRLESGGLIVHSTAPFEAEHVEQIRSLGEVRWITDPMVDHDTFSRQGQEAFSEASFLAPEGFPSDGGLKTQPLLPVPVGWGQEVEVVKLEGAQGFNEHVFFHVPSRTLIVCDLLMHFPEVNSLWERALLRVGLGPRRAPGTSRRLKLAVKDMKRFQESMQQVMDWPFERVVVGHGEPLCDNAYERSKAAWVAAGWVKG
ncbi:DUF4336 domain-containing protein [Pelagicoccus sp. SDUM812002]|uniref:DUF4336 domain-containing protein n=1 Tax=Pelagicoccus sp. SDUM812002 TaxID=3041266 RepID=UPI00280D5EDB|nr:DUF4336 domain-containing protein [Pelagicoccus sp. SDUM812002]MDQ8185778.1 DUF4336 domain-containing protein [Pelagicoccus sp. SDUM812002]